MSEELPKIVLSEDLRRECERKNVGHEDMEMIARFQTFLTVWGKPGEELSEDRKATARAMLADPEWREFILGETDGSDPTCVDPTQEENVHDRPNG